MSKKKTLAEVYARFERSVAGGQHAEAQGCLAELKVALLEEEEELPELGRKTMEQAVLLAVATHDSAAFQRHLAQLKPYYAVDASSPLRPTLLGLELLFLIVENRLADFHMELEDENLDRSAPELAFAITIEQNLMVGSYDQVLRATVPSPHFAFFMSRLLDTVRDTIAECAEAAYASLTVDAAKDLLMFDNLHDLQAFIAKFDTWKLQGGGNTIVFDAQQKKPLKSDMIPAVKLITENLAYATELERIV